MTQTPAITTNKQCRNCLLEVNLKRKKVHPSQIATEMLLM